MFLGSPYNLYPLRYTLVPGIASLRWHVNGIGGPLFLRGNWDVTFSGSYTAIPRGAETRYFSYDMGIRRNFVPRDWRIAPYWDLRFGLGDINAKGPLGVYYAQGQNFTFTMNMGSGLRYNINQRYAISLGLNYMHISNANMSAPQYSNYGINVYGPMIGIDMLLPTRPHSTLASSHALVRTVGRRRTDADFRRKDSQRYWVFMKSSDYSRPLPGMFSENTNEFT